MECSVQGSCSAVVRQQKEVVTRTLLLLVFEDACFYRMQSRLVLIAFPPLVYPVCDDEVG